MQGLTVTVSDTMGGKSVAVKFPDAKMVRSKVLRHPNEVKAMTNTDGTEKRPDLQPLISALNDTVSCVEYSDRHTIVSPHNISLNRDAGELTFSIVIPNHLSFTVQSELSVVIETGQSASLNNPEFVGKRLSSENRMPQGGLGQMSVRANDERRNFRIVRSIILK